MAQQLLKSRKSLQQTLECPYVPDTSKVSNLISLASALASNRKMKARNKYYSLYLIFFLTGQNNPGFFLLLGNILSTDIITIWK